MDFPICTRAKNIEQVLNAITERFESYRTIMIAQHNAGKSISSATKGAEREEFIRLFLSRILPNSYRFSCGDIIDQEGTTVSEDNIPGSGQVDIVLEAKYEPSFPMPTTEQRLILAESVIAAVEVKSSRTQWDEFLKKTQRVKCLNRKMRINCMSGNDDQSEMPISHLFNVTNEIDAQGAMIEAGKIPIIGVFYEGWTNRSTLESKIQKIPYEQRPDAVLTIDPGYFVYHGKTYSGAQGLYAFVVLLTKLANFIDLAETCAEDYLA